MGAPDGELPRAAELMWPQAMRFFQDYSIPIPRWLNSASRSGASLVERAAGAAGLKLDIQSIIPHKRPHP